MCSVKSKKHTVFTIGHSTRTITDFIDLLKEFGIKKVVDIRTIPKSQHNPQFNEEQLRTSLHNHHIGYTHMPDLGGLRHTSKNSINTGWHNSSFRGFADYMQTEQFHNAVEKLATLAQKTQLVIMCAEAVPWRCHRSLIGDALLVRHYDVEDIYNHGTIKPHTLTSFAQVNGKHITYPPDDA